MVRPPEIVTEPPGEPTGKGVCFVAMPSGHEPAEKDWFSGWYSEVIERVLSEIGYTPHLAAASAAPSSITTEILTHLVEAPMAVVDIGGASPDDAPNPNVWYELGVRHAFGKPAVIMGWKGQTVPFDVKDQRALLEDRTPNHFQRNRDRLADFVGEAEGGNYHKPIESVAQVAQVSGALSADKALQVLAETVFEMRDELRKVATVTSELNSERLLQKIRELEAQRWSMPNALSELMNLKPPGVGRDKTDDAK